VSAYRSHEACTFRLENTLQNNWRHCWRSSLSSSGFSTTDHPSWSQIE